MKGEPPQGRHLLLGVVDDGRNLMLELMAHRNGRHHLGTRGRHLFLHPADLMPFRRQARNERPSLVNSTHTQSYAFGSEMVKVIRGAGRASVRGKNRSQ